jgi:hypothetical protein
MSTKKTPVSPVKLIDASKLQRPVETNCEAAEVNKLQVKVDRGDPLSIGTAIHMMTASVRSCKVNDRGFLYEDVHHTGTRITYLSEAFSLLHFVAVLKISFGALSGYRSLSFKVLFHFSHFTRRIV